MSDTANVASAAYRRYFPESPETTESRTVGTESAHGLSGEPISLHWADELEELRGREMSVAWGASPVGFETLSQPSQSVTIPSGVALLVQNGRVLVGEHQAGVPTWTSNVGLKLFESAYHLANTSPHSSEGALQRAVLHYGAVLDELLPHDDRDLQKALSDFDLLKEEAREEDLPEPDVEAVANARTLLPRLYAILPVRYRVSPTERRGVAINAPMRWGASVAVECAPDDTVYCFAAIDGNSRRAKFYQMDGLPDVFIEKALRDLAGS